MTELHSIENIKDEILLEALRQDHSIRDAKKNKTSLEDITDYVLFDMQDYMEINKKEEMHILFQNSFKNIGILVDFKNKKHLQILKEFTEKIYNLDDD